jgi:hypothetical protein
VWCFETMLAIWWCGMLAVCRCETPSACVSGIGVSWCETRSACLNIASKGDCGTDGAFALARVALLSHVCRAFALARLGTRAPLGPFVSEMVQFVSEMVQTWRVAVNEMS